MVDSPFRSVTEARAQLHMLQLVRDHPRSTTAEYAQRRGRKVTHTGVLLRRFAKRGWAQPDRGLPAHWTITAAGEKVLRDYGHLLAPTTDG